MQIKCFQTLKVDFLIIHFFTSSRPLKKCAGKSTPPIELKLCTNKLYTKSCPLLQNEHNSLYFFINDQILKNSGGTYYIFTCYTPSIAGIVFKLVQWIDLFESFHLTPQPTSCDILLQSYIFSKFARFALIKYANQLINMHKI